MKKAEREALQKEQLAAKKAFETIKTDYPASTEAQNIEAYIAIAE